MTTEAEPVTDAANFASKPAIARLSYHVVAIVATRPYSKAFFVTVGQRMPQPLADKHHHPRQLTRLDHCLDSAPRPLIPDTVVGLLTATIVEN